VDVIRAVIEKLGYSDRDIELKRELIKEKLKTGSPHITSDNFEVVKDSDLCKLFMFYNECFLENKFSIEFIDGIVFKFTRRLKRSGGITKIFQSNKDKSVRYEIHINLDMIFEFSYSGESRHACGVEVNSSMDALLAIFEHEICHVLEHVVYGSTSCKKERFKDMAVRLFGHGESTHGLMTAQEKLSKEYGLKVGDRVSFEFEGKIYRGMIGRITKRATVYVEDKKGGFVSKDDGKRYGKFLIPLGHLKKTE